MALVKDDLTMEMINAVKSCPNGGDDAMAELGSAIEDYLVANTDAVYAWAAKDPTTSVPDPATSFNAELSVSGTKFQCRPNDFNDFISKLAKWLNKIKINAASGWSLPPLNTDSGTFTADQLYKLADEADCDGAMLDAFGIISQGIIDGWSSYFVSSESGSHTKFEGAASLTSVS